MAPKLDRKFHPDAVHPHWDAAAVLSAAGLASAADAT
jgi:hypothetical protein